MDRIRDSPQTLYSIVRLHACVVCVSKINTYLTFPFPFLCSNHEDVVVFSVYDKAYNHCGDEPIGTYMTPVGNFVQGYLQQQSQDYQDQGLDYQEPSVSQYAYCVPQKIQNNKYIYLQLGCADDSNQGLAVNIYSDIDCKKRSSNSDGMDDANIDMSQLQLPFKQCQNCVNWFDMNQNVDDQYYELHKTQAPLCATAWTYKQTCDGKCKRLGQENSTNGWQTSDQVLLSILVLFAAIMLGLIAHKRQMRSNKDTLLEQAAMSAAGLQQPHVIGVCILVTLVVAVFALLGLKNITWTLLLAINTALFGYLMKLTLQSSPPENIIGPDGTIMRNDSDDSSVDDESSKNAGGATGFFTLPTLT